VAIKWRIESLIDCMEDMDLEMNSEILFKPVERQVSEYMLMLSLTTCLVEVMMFGKAIEMAVEEDAHSGAPKSPQINHHTLLKILCTKLLTTLN